MGMGMDDNLNGVMWVHLWSISFRLFRDLLSAIAIMVFSDKHKSQNLDPLEYGLAFNSIFHFTIGLRPFFFNCKNVVIKELPNPGLPEFPMGKLWNAHCYQ